MLRTRLLSLCALALISNLLLAESTSRRFELDLSSLGPERIREILSPNFKGYRVAVALSGGGARGFAHLGVLSALEKNGIDIDIVAGASMGGIIGGLYASGMTPEEIERAALAIDWRNLFSDKPKRGSLLFTQRAEAEGELLTLRFDGLMPQIPTAVTSGQKLVDIFNNLTQSSAYFSGGDFSKLRRRLSITATDIVKGEKVVFRSGPLVTAMRATVGVPLAFTPLEREEQLLMDGGLLTPIPTDEARVSGADFVIAVNTSSELLRREEISNPVDIANQTTTILSAPYLREALNQADFVITPELTDIKATDFDKIREAISRGKQMAEQVMPTLMQLIEHRRNNSEALIVDAVDINSSRDPNIPAGSDLPGRLQQLTAHRLTAEEIDQTMHGIFRSQLLQSISWQIDSLNDETLLRVQYHALVPPKKIVISGNQVFDDSTLLGESGWAGSSLDSIAELALISERMTDYYRKHGYDLASIRSAVYDTLTGCFGIEIDEGIIKRITVEGNRKTRAWAVRSYFPLKEGDPYSKHLAARGLRDLHASGLFENVGLQLNEESGGVWVKLQVKEKKFTYARLGGHYHEEFHSEAFAKVGYANLGGTGNDLSVYSRFSERHKLFQVQLKADRIFRTFVTYNVRLYYANDKIGQFFEDQLTGLRTDKHLGIRIGIGQQLARLGLLDVTARLEEVRMHLPGVSETGKRRITSLQFNLRYDTKDRYTFPAKGRASAISFEVASDVLGGEDVFRKFEGYLESYQYLARKLNFRPRVAIGLSQDGLPLYDKFYLGGTRTFIGYHQDQLAGDKYIVSNFELRVGPIYSLYLSFRYDMGEAFGRFEEIRFDHLRNSIGVILALDTPIGPISLGYGRAEARYDNLYFNLGYDF